jgi:RNA polymerase sigma factor (TIGR02999 family)
LLFRLFIIASPNIFLFLLNKFVKWQNVSVCCAFTAVFPSQPNKTQNFFKTGQTKWQTSTRYMAYAKMTGKLASQFAPSYMTEMPSRSPDITQLLVAWRAGDETALDTLIPAVYSELRRIAGNLMRRQNPGHTLQASALVNEAFMRLVDSNLVDWQSRTHFFAVSAQLMRRVLVDAARKRNSQKRGGDRVRITLDERADLPKEAETDLVALDDALTRLAELNPRHSKIVELRYFGGLTEEQVAETLKISARTVRRDWSVARAWLYRELQS